MTYFIAPSRFCAVCVIVIISQVYATKRTLETSNNQSDERTKISMKSEPPPSNLDIPTFRGQEMYENPQAYLARVKKQAVAPKSPETSTASKNHSTVAKDDVSTLNQDKAPPLSAVVSLPVEKLDVEKEEPSKAETPSDAKAVPEIKASKKISSKPADVTTEVADVVEPPVALAVGPIPSEPVTEPITAVLPSGRIEHENTDTKSEEKPVSATNTTSSYSYIPTTRMMIVVGLVIIVLSAIVLTLYKLRARKQKTPRTEKSTLDTGIKPVEPVFDGLPRSPFKQTSATGTSHNTYKMDESVSLHDSRIDSNNNFEDSCFTDTSHGNPSFFFADSTASSNTYSDLGSVMSSAYTGKINKRSSFVSDCGSILYGNDLDSGNKYDQSQGEASNFRGLSDISNDWDIQSSRYSSLASVQAKKNECEI